MGLSLSLNKRKGTFFFFRTVFLLSYHGRQHRFENRPRSQLGSIRDYSTESKTIRCRSSRRRFSHVKFRCPSVGYVNYKLIATITKQMT